MAFGDTATTGAPNASISPFTGRTTARLILTKPFSASAHFWSNWGSRKDSNVPSEIPLNTAV